MPGSLSQSESTPKRQFQRYIGPLAGLGLFAVALWILHHQLRTHQLTDILRQFHGIPSGRISLALALTALSYLIMTGYDFLALIYVHHPLPYRRTALASFVGYAFSNNIGLSMIAGASVRYRLYSAWGLTTLETSKIVGFCALTLWLGFFLVGGSVFLLEPLAVPEGLHMPVTSVRPLGMALLAVVAGYLLWGILRKRPLAVRGWQIPLPAPRLVLTQMVIASCDWVLASSVLYALLPPLPGLSFAGLVGIFMLAQLAGLISQVPGGLGVLETVALILLSPFMPQAEAFGVLLTYRVIYYLIPFALAIALLGSQEILQGKALLQRVAASLGTLGATMVPHALSMAVFAGGAVLLFSSATPAHGWRLGVLKALFPLPLLEISHFLGSLAGTVLLFLARGLQRRLYGAYIATAALLASGVVLSLLKGLDYEEALLLTLVLAALVASRRNFYRRSALLDERYGSGWIAAVLIVVLTSLWLGVFSFKHVAYSHELWWHFALRGDAPRFLRATVAIAAVLLAFSAARLLRGAATEPTAPSRNDQETVAGIVAKAEETYANLALLGDKRFLFNDNRDAFVMYEVEGRSWVVMGDPVGPPEARKELVWRFRELSDRHDGWAVFYEVGTSALPLYLDLGLSLLKLGEEGRVSLETFSLEGGARKGLRHTYRKLEKEGCRFEILSPEAVLPLLPELKGISEAWLREKNTREKGFSLGRFEETYLSRYPFAFIRKKQRILAFSNLWCGANRQELSIDLMRHASEAPNGIMEYLFIQLMLWGKEQGYRWFNLGMAPFSGLEDHSLAPLWSRFGAYLFQHAEHFYNLRGLRQYKEKFDPQWTPKYLACPGGLAVPRVLANVAALISGGAKGVVAR